MREINSDDLESLEKGQLILLTLKMITPHEPLLAADFRDTQVPIFVKTGNYLGFSANKEIKFGKKPAKMVNGLWIINEEECVQKEHENMIMNPEWLSMEFIR